MWRGRLDVLFDVNGTHYRTPAVPLVARQVSAASSSSRSTYYAHSAAAATGRSLDNHRISDLFGNPRGLLFVFDRTVSCRE